MAGVEFAGNGSKDLSSSVESTGAEDTNRGSEKAIEFAGDGASDVSHACNTNSGRSEQMPSGGIKFAG